MLEELFAAFVIGISFSNAFICILLGFGTSSVEQRQTGLFFISGRFVGLIIIGLLIALLGVFFSDQITYFIILFGILTIVFGGFIIFKIYRRYQRHSISGPKSPELNNHIGSDNGGCMRFGHRNTNPGCSVHFRTNHNNQKNVNNENQHPSTITSRYSFFLGIFRGATPCLKLIILAPLLIVVELQLALLMILIFASASTLYPIIGFLSANLLTSFKKYDAYVQVVGAFVLISIGIFTISKIWITQTCSLGV
jgi:cytochrome c biogenesis protein CcdA